MFSRLADFRPPQYFCLTIKNFAKNVVSNFSSDAKAVKRLYRMENWL
jgi:hypothetical protein